MNLKKIFLKKEQLLAVSFLNESLSLLKLKQDSAKYLVDFAFLEPLPANTIVNHTVLAPENLALRLREIVEENNLANSNVVTFIPADLTLVKNFSVPAMPTKALKSHLKMQLNNCFGNGFEKIRFDYQILSKTRLNHYQVLTASVKESVLESYLDVFRLAGLNVVLVDSSYFALQNCFEFNYPEYLANKIALVDIYSRVAHVLIIKNKQLIKCFDIELETELGNLSKTSSVMDIFQKIKQQLEQNRLETNEPTEMLFLTGNTFELNLETVKNEFQTENIEVRLLEPNKALSTSHKLTNDFAICLGGAIRSINDSINKDYFVRNSK